jgi:hypothetical protein
MNDRLLTIAEVSEMLRGPIATLRWWRHIGEGPRGLTCREARTGGQEREGPS